MVQTLAQFYNSEAWRKFREVLILQRTSPDGILRSDYSGAPLLKRYDVVAHHKIELTVDNMNDAEISLNPENVMLVSQREHNEIHARFGFMAGKKVYYVYGPPCSGKTTFVRSVKGNSDIVIDIDSIWECLTGEGRYVKPAALKENVFGVRDLLFDMIRTRKGRWERAYVIDGGARKGDRERKIELLGAEGIYIDTDRKKCLARLASDEKRGGAQRQEWTRYIDQWFEEFQK